MIWAEGKKYPNALPRQLRNAMVYVSVVPWPRELCTHRQLASDLSVAGRHGRGRKFWVGASNFHSAAWHSITLLVASEMFAGKAALEIV